METALDKFLCETKFETINDIWNAFELCKTLADAQRVVDSIPFGFGDFLIDLCDEKGNQYPPEAVEDNDEFTTPIIGFNITNIFFDPSLGNVIDEMYFDWYKD